jgi:hypothetical protein
VLAAKDISKLLEGIPRGHGWHLSANEERPIAYAAGVTEVVKRAKEPGESAPTIVRVPKDSSSFSVEHYLEHGARFRQKVRAGLRQLDQGEFVTHEEIGARIEEIGRR